MAIAKCKADPAVEVGVTSVRGDCGDMVSPPHGFGELFQTAKVLGGLWAGKSDRHPPFAVRRGEPGDV